MLNQIFPYHVAAKLHEVQLKLPAGHEKKSHNAKKTQNVFVWQKGKEHKENLASSSLIQACRYTI